MDNELIHVVILDRENCRLGMLNEDIATTLVAVCSEDPVDWNEMLSYWPRYTTRVVPELLTSLPVEIVEREQAVDSIGTSQNWIVIDLIQKRFLSGKAFQPIERDACFAMYTDENGDQHDPLSVHFPPWWELQEQVEAGAINSPRPTPLQPPVIDREFLFGEATIHDLADRILQVANSGRLSAAIEETKPDQRNPFYSLTIEVHRDWLMTPREDIGGMYPRQMLHGGTDWIDRVIWGHRLRFERGGGKIIAAPKETYGYKHAPMGREELAMYFDLCRELIAAGWFWCERNLLGLDASVNSNTSETAEAIEFPTDREKLIGFLKEVKLDWLTSPFEGGSAPTFILECSRRRIPRGSGVEIVGMDERQSAEHIIDCDCPICVMMAEGKMGIGFCSIDGHHLELDNEFAFSMHETRDAWEAEQQEWAEQSAKWEQERIERERQAAENGDNHNENQSARDEEEEFASAWSGGVSDDPIPGDAGGNLKLAFLMAEIVSEMKSAEGSEPETSNELRPTESISTNSTPNDPASKQLASSELVKQLNVDFSMFRNSSYEDLAENTNSLTDALEQVATVHPNLVARIADFQSRIIEHARRPIPSSEPFSQKDWEDDFPF